MDNLTKSSMNFLTSSRLDRLESNRRDPQDQLNLIKSPYARFLAVRRGEVLLVNKDSKNPHFYNRRDLPENSLVNENCFLLGKKDNLIFFAVNPDLISEGVPEPDGTLFTSLRESTIGTQHWTGGLLAQALALVSWHENNRFCSKCGSITEASQLGQVRNCTNRECNASHFPRTDAAVIVAITFKDKLLMGRQSQWPENMYSVIAGFVDHGESLEDTVVREVMEETGISVKNIRYHSSQPWPFPHSMMIGYFAEAENGNIEIDKHELEEARWFTRDEMIQGLKNKNFVLPTPYSISRRLISDWFDNGKKGCLTDYIDH